MIATLKQIYQLLSEQQKRRYLRLQLLIIVMAFFELFGVASIAPFMAVVGDESILQQPGLLQTLYLWTELESEREFLIVLGLGVLVALGASTLVSIFTTWKLSLFATQIGAEISSKLYGYYIRESWLFHTSTNSSALVKEISTEVHRITYEILLPFVYMNAMVVMALFIAVALFVFDPLVALAGMVFFTLSYMAIYQLIRRQVMRNGTAISTTAEQRFKLMNEGFGGIKDTILLGRQSMLSEHFSHTSQQMALAQGQNSALSLVPKFFLEFMVFGALVALVIYMLWQAQGNLAQVLPVLSIYALAGFKLLPAFQRVYSGMVLIKGSVSAFEAIKDDWAKANQLERRKSVIATRLSLQQQIVLDEVSFYYPGKSEPALEKVSLQIRAKQIIGVVGPSGSGKSTFVDLLMGLMTAQSGSIAIDGQPLEEGNIRRWQNNIGYVAQSIFLTEGSIAQNIAFGLPLAQIDMTKVQRCLKLAHLDEWVSSLEQGVMTEVGERGVQLSGGQRQRIGIARALYHDADVLVFDEATSALDSVTEKLIMQAIHDFSGQKTIILIAHRLNTIEKCDQVFYFEGGRLSNQGTFKELLQHNPQFRAMAKQAS